jgi:multidrug efflux pump
MKWVAACQQHKLLVYIAAIVVCLLGLFFLYTIPIAPFPEFHMNKFEINFKYPGANAATVQTQITQKVENALRSISNVQQISALSKSGAAVISLILESDDAQNSLQTEIKIMQAISSAHIPTSVPQPIISVSSSQSGLIVYMVSSSKWNIFNIDNYIQATLYPKFSSLPGVTVFSNNRDPVVKISLIPAKLAEYGLSATDVAEQLNAVFHSSPMGSMYLNQQPYELNLANPIHSIPGFENVVVGYQKPAMGGPIYLKNIAHVGFMSRSIVPSYYSSLNGKVADAIILYTTTRANPFLVTDASQKYVRSLQGHMPGGLKIHTIFNNADTMHASFNELVTTIVIAAFLVLLIALVFLGHFRTTLIPIATIPVCLAGAIIFINLLGMSVNMLSLLAMVIAVGLVVDDAIVVVENITRHLEAGMSKHDAILHGTTDIATTVIGITATLLAVYLPISFCSGAFITMLKAFAMPLAAAVFISGIVALTLTPVMCTTLVKDEAPNRYQLWFSRVFQAMIGRYHAALKCVLRFSWVSLVVVVILVVLGAYIGLKSPQTFFPNDPIGVVDITFGGAPGDTVASLKKQSVMFAPFYNASAVKYWMLDIQSQNGRLGGKITLMYKAQYLQKTLGFSAKINAFIKKNHLANAYAAIEKVNNWGGYDIALDLYGSSDIEKINQAALKITGIMKKNPMFAMANNTINYPVKQLAFDVDTVKAAKFGIYKPQIAALLSTFYGGFTLNNNFNIDKLSVPVVVQLGRADMQNPASLQKLQIKSPLTGQFYPLDTFVTTHVVAEPTAINSFDGQPSVEIIANMAKGYSLAKAFPFIDGVIKNSTPGFQHSYTGAALTYLQGNHQTLLIVVLGLLCIYFLLAILFNNLLDPFIILLTVPFSVVGGLLSLHLIGGSINLYSTIGLITLIGLITKHGVLIVKFANNELASGVGSVREAVLNATQHRFRPILMTTLAMTLGALPLVLSDKIMYVARDALGVTLIGGLLIGTIFSLFIVPLVYTFVKRLEA